MPVAAPVMLPQNPGGPACFAAPAVPDLESLFDLPATLLPVTLPGESCLDTFFFSRLQIKRMPFDLFDDVFLLHFSLKATEGVL